MENKAKKMIIALLAFVIIFTITGCIIKDNKEGLVKDLYTSGVYQGIGEGKNGRIVAEVTFSKDKIEKIEIIEQHETEGLSDKAIKELPASIVKNQSLGVDVVSGASLTNTAIMEAIEEAIGKAGGDVESLKRVAVEKELSNEVVELSSDVVVVGGGASGISASLRADELGLSTILFEKMSYLGGSISISGGNQVVMGSKLQESAGVKDDSVESFIADFLKNGDNKNAPDLLNLYAENVGQTTDWLNEYVGIEYDPDLHKLAEYSHDRELAYKDGGPGFAKTARGKVEASKIDVHLETPVNEITVNNKGEIDGVIARSLDGTTYKVKTKAVVVASGGYGNNKELLSEELKEVLYYGSESSTGDGIVLTSTKDIDAATRLMEYGKMYPNGVEISEGKAKSTIGGNIVVFKENAILINSGGKRVVNEKSSNKQILEIELAQPEKKLYVLMDQEAFDLFKPAVAEAGISESDLDKWVKSNGSKTPFLFNGNTIDDLAKASGIDISVLNETVKTYNQYVKDGEDKEFNRPTEFMKKEIGKGPYYLIEQKPRFATTMGGLMVNGSLQVLNKEGNVIPGLYSAGEIAGGVMGDDSPSGANNAWALTSGKYVSEVIKKDLK